MTKNYPASSFSRRIIFKNVEIVLAGFTNYFFQNTSFLRKKFVKYITLASISGMEFKSFVTLREIKLNFLFGNNTKMFFYTSVVSDVNSYILNFKNLKFTKN